jgi:hypothetical protein
VSSPRGPDERPRRSSDLVDGERAAHDGDVPAPKTPADDAATALAGGAAPRSNRAADARGPAASPAASADDKGSTIAARASADAAAFALGPWSRRIIRALAEVVLPAAEDAPRVPLDEVARFVDSFVPKMPRLLRALFPVGLLLLELGAFVLGPSLRPFSAMSLARRRRYVDGWVHARWRLRRDLIKAVKGLCLLCYYSDPRVCARLGYEVHAHVTLVAAERLRRHAHDI